MWKTLKNYPEYEINKEGDIRRKKTKRILRPFSSNGYLMVSLNGKTEYISRLVAQTFLRKRKFKNEVKHINLDKQDNRVSNLKWAEHKEIQEDIYNSGRHARGGAEPPKAIRVLETGETFSSIHSCGRELHISPSNIRKCLKGEHESWNGLHFELIKNL